MIIEKFNLSDTDRDPNVYLGIDHEPIPFHHFKGVYREHGMVFTDDVVEGLQFIVNIVDDVAHVVLVGMNVNRYVTIEDLENDRWLKIGNVLGNILGEYSTTGYVPRITNKCFETVRDKLVERYKSGEQGKLEIEEKIYDSNGVYYMWFHHVFVTDIEGEDSFHKMRRHIDFVSSPNYIFDLSPKNIKCSKKTWDEIIKGLRDNGFLPTGIDYRELNIPCVDNARLSGLLCFVETPINNIIVERQEK